MRLRVRLRARKIVERAIGDANNMIANKRRALGRARFGMLDAALPLHHRPARIIVLRHLAEYLREIDLAVTQRTESPRPIDPILIAAINACAATRAELRILHMKRAHALVIKIEKRQIIQLLQNHVARVVENVGAR